MHELRYSRALLLVQLRALEISARNSNAPPVRPELLLADAGFTAREIADILGKSYGAIAKALSRARAGRTRESLAEEFNNEEGEAGHGD